MRSVPFARPWIFFSFYPIGDSFLSRLNNRVANRRIPARSLRAIRFERVRTGARTETSMFSARYNEVFAQLGLLGSRGGVIREVEGSFDGTLAIRGIYETKTNGNYDFLFRETSREKKGWGRRERESREWRKRLSRRFCPEIKYLLRLR